MRIQKRYTLLDNSPNKVYLVPSFHYDNAWNLSSRFYAKFTSDRIIKRAIEILRKERDFRFTIDHLPSLEDFLKRYPKESDYLIEEIKKERVEIVGPMYTQPDCLVLGGELLIRQILYGAKWIKTALRAKPSVEWLVDVYGYCNQLPQILKKAGIRYLVIGPWWMGIHREGKRYLKKLSPYGDFSWEGVDGSRIVVHCTPTYAGLYLPGDEYISNSPHYQMHNRRKKQEAISSPDAYEKAKEAFIKEYRNLMKWSLPRQKKLFMHMGGDFREPCLQNIDMIRKMRKDTSLPEIKLALPSEYFRSLRRGSLTIFKGEINPIYKERFGEGYYETKVQIKQMNRQFEYKMTMAESLSAIAYLLGKEYPSEKIETAYKPFLFYQHHDPFIGCIPKREFSLSIRKGRDSIQMADKIIGSSIDYIVSKIKINTPGIPIAVFNALSWSRRDLADFTMDFPEEYQDFGVENEQGESLPVQTKVIGRKRGIRKIRLSILTSPLPSCGYEVFHIVRNGKIYLYEKGLSITEDAGHFRVESDFYFIIFNERGNLKSLYDKNVKREILKKAEFSANEFILEEDLGCFCFIRPTGKIWREKVIENVRIIEKGPLFCKIRAFVRIKDVKVQKELIFYSFTKRIDFITKVYLPDGENLRLKTVFPVKSIRGEITAETPFSYQKRKEGISPMNKWVDYTGDGTGLTIFTKGLSSYEVKRGNIFLNLIKGLSLKDPMDACLLPRLRKEMIERGNFQFDYAIESHGGRFDIEETVRTGYDFNIPILGVKVRKKDGKMASKLSFFNLEPENLVVHTIKKGEDGDTLILRIYETAGKSRTLGELNFYLPIKDCLFCNLLEEEVKPLNIKDNSVRFLVRNHEIITIKLRFGD